MGLFEDLLSLNTEVRGESETRRFYERFAICDLRFMILNLYHYYAIEFTIFDLRDTEKTQSFLKFYNQES